VELANRCESLQERLSQLERELEHTNRLATLGTIVGSIAHEFNNLLTPVVSYAELAKLHPEDRELASKALDRASAGAEHASQIASAILDLVRRAEKVSNPPAAPIQEVVDKALLCMAREPAQDGIALTMDIERGLEAEIEPVSLQQVLLNILLNAINAMREQGGGELVVRASGSTWNADGREGVKITVADTGPGIPPDKLERLFQPFAVVGDRLSDGRAGTGLGLSIVQRLVESAGGRIEAASTVGEGTTFTLSLRRARDGAMRRSA
jgi:signal transduction histidine kinase